MTGLRLAFDIATTNTVDWNPGIPGGIPRYPNAINARDYGATGDGVTDDYAAITSAINACTNGGAVYLPPGRYRCSRGIVLARPKQVVLRGAGPNSTFIDSYTTSERAGIVISSSMISPTAHRVLSGYQRNSTLLTLDSVSGFSVGMVINISQDNDPTEIFGTLEGTTESRQSQMVTITNITGTVVAIDRPLYYSYKSSLNPVAHGYPLVTTRCGVENLTLVSRSQPSGDGWGIFMYVAKQCWLDNVVVTNAPHANIMLSYCYQSTVRGCATYNHQAYDSNARYGIQLTLFCTDCLIEDNIFSGNNLGIVLQQGVVGNVVAYNFSNRGYGNGYPTSLTLRWGIAFHGSNPNMNLVEGNVVQNLALDDYWGCNRKNTFFRNWATCVSYNNPQNQFASDGSSAAYIEAGNYWNNFVGNVLLTPKPSNFEDWDFGHSPIRHGNSAPAAPYDPNVRPRTLTHGNFSFATRTTQWDSQVTERDLPKSLYLTNAPAWFGSLPWPPIGPDVNTSNSITNAPVIPAQARALGLPY